MSTLTKTPPAPKLKIPMWIPILVVAIIVALLVIPNFFPHKTHFLLAKPDGWIPAYTNQVQILGTRISIVNGGEAPEADSGTQYYRAEAEVSWQYKGQQLDEWLPASQVTADRDHLDLWLAHKDVRLATVYWNPGAPTKGIVILLSGSGGPYGGID